MLILALGLVAAACSESDDTEGSTNAGDDAAAADAADDASPDDASPDDASTDDDSAADDAASDDTGDGDDDSSGDDAAVDDGSVVAMFAGEPWFLGEVPAAAVAAGGGAEPIKIGMINQENTPLGSFPEMRGAAQAAVAWINAELGGVGGRPIELTTCVTSFNVEQSQACAQDLVQEGVTALVGGIDVTSNGSLPVLQQNGLPTIGGIPANLSEQQSDVNFFFSGGTAGGMAAMIAHADKNGAESVMIAYGEFESFEVAARDYAAPVAESLGMRVELRPFPIVGADMLQILTAANTADVDALIVNAADASCVPVMQGAIDLEVRAQIYLVGACAAEEILDAAGSAAAGVVYSGEGPADADAVEGAIYDEVVERFAVDPAGGAGTVGFRGMMNLYSLLTELGPENISSEAITELVRSAVDRPSFWGHSYTCDGQRIPGLPALCAVEQSLFTTTGVPGEDIVFLPEGFEETDGWIETDDLYAAALG